MASRYNFVLYAFREERRTSSTAENLAPVTKSRQMLRCLNVSSASLFIDFVHWRGNFLTIRVSVRGDGVGLRSNVQAGWCTSNSKDGIDDFTLVVSAMEGTAVPC